MMGLNLELPWRSPIQSSILCTIDEMDDSVLLVLLVEGLVDIVDPFTENGREAGPHGSLRVHISKWLHLADQTLT